FSWEHPTLVGQVCGLGAIAIMEAALNLQSASGKPVKVIQASSAEIFGNPEQIPQTETTPIRPVNPYGTAKAYAHLSASVFRSRGLPVSTVILYNHESPRRPETFVTRKITAQVARIARDGGGTLSLGNLESRRDWGWAPDYVDAMLLIAAQPEADDYVIATGKAHSVGEFAAAAFAQVGIENWRDYVIVDPNLVRPAEAALQVGDATKARVRLGWRPTVGFAELVGRMVDNDVALLDKGEKP
ncbi:MAG: GDP-mannose 4,6-dehydratase, partial [Promicromonosporaceae bacterium]|nr:GDP-mannose 4,6-dehydratase [Promicromonosporaceae bacterium]